MSIPRIIHYCWFGHNPLPSEVEDCIASWRKFCPGFEIVQWNESNFDIDINQYVKEAYFAKKWAFVADFARLWIINNEGGVYLDTDVELIKPLDSILEQAECVVAEEVSGRINTGVGFAASAHHPVVESMLRQYDNARFQIQPKVYDLTPCPVRNTRALKEMGYTGKAGRLSSYDCIVLPPEMMSPINPETGDKRISSKTVSIHHFSGTWKSEKEKEKYEKKRKMQQEYGKIGALIYYIQSVVSIIQANGLQTTFKIIFYRLKTMMNSER